MSVLMNVPSDPVMLLSVINTKLRDYYESLEQLCNDMRLDQDAIIEKLHAIDYEYDADYNQFV